jgi:hypothetical protein
MKILITLMFCGIGLADGAEPASVQLVLPTNYVAGPQYAASTNECRPYVVFTGTNTHIKARGCFRVTATEEWVDLWLRHTGQSAEGMYFEEKYKYWNNPGGVPAVDFTRCVIVALIQGPGFKSEGFEVAAVVTEGETTVLRVAEKWYQSIGHRKRHA